MDLEKQEGFHRLGKRELGRHAFEDRMPDRMATVIAAEGTQNALEGVIPKLARLLEHDRTTKVAYMCTDSAVQVYKVPDEGAHFCGYRNIQILLLALRSCDVSIPAKVHLEQKLGVAQVQDMIEAAWDEGHNAHGRVQTGGIRGTRKHIGTSEAEALLMSLDIPCTGTAFAGKDAWRELLDFVEKYFASSPDTSSHIVVHQTARPPIFLQRPKHSLTIIGIERTRSGKRRLLTFDPAWRPPSAMRELLPELKQSGWTARWTLKRYRKSERYLGRYGEFETLTVDRVP